MYSEMGIHAPIVILDEDYLPSGEGLELLWEPSTSSVVVQCYFDDGNDEYIQWGTEGAVIVQC